MAFNSLHSSHLYPDGLPQILATLESYAQNSLKGGVWNHLKESRSGSVIENDTDGEV
jgi:hypothetical protein